MPTTTTKPTRPGPGPNFTLLWSGESVSLLGSATTAVLIPLLAVTSFHAGPGWMGLLTAAAWLPWLVVGLPAGTWLDRGQPRPVMIIANLVSAATLATVPLSWWLGILTLPQLLIVALVNGIATVFFRTAFVKLIPLIVPDEGLETANARLFGTESAMQVAGPGLAGVFTQVASAAAGLVLDVVGFLASAWCLWRIKLDARPRTRSADAAEPAVPSDPAVLSEPDEATERFRARIAKGVRVVLQDRHLRSLMIIGGSSNFGLTGYSALLVLFLVGELGLSSAVLGLVLAIGSVGGLVGALTAPALARRIGTGRASTTLFLLSGPSALLIAAPVQANQAYLTAAGLLLVGVGVVGGNVIRGAWRQRYVPAQLMGRVMTTMQVVNYGTMPAAGLAAGALGHRFGVQTAMLLLAAVHALACLSVLLTRFGRGRDLPTPPR